MTIVLSVRRSGPLFALCMVLGVVHCRRQRSRRRPPPGRPIRQLIEDLVAANRILADHGLLDGWGHVSVRHDQGSEPLPDGARACRPTLVTAKDIIEFDLDSRPVDTHGLPMSALFTERYIHGEIYKMRPDVIAVVHTHAPSLIPFGDTKVPLQADVRSRGIHRFRHSGVRNSRARRNDRHADPQRRRLGMTSPRRWAIIRRS